MKEEMRAEENGCAHQPVGDPGFDLGPLLIKERRDDASRCHAVPDATAPDRSGELPT